MARKYLPSILVLGGGTSQNTGMEPSILNPTQSAEKCPLASRPRPLNNKQVHGPFEDFSVIEVQKAIESLAPHKAPGPDGIVSEFLRNLPCPLLPLTQLFNIITGAGKIPGPIVQLYLLLLGKPRKSPSLCGYEKPISLIRSVGENAGSRRAKQTDGASGERLGGTSVRL